MGGLTAAKSFQIRCYIPCPALASSHAQSIIRYFAVPFGRPGSFTCAIHMYTSVGGKAPSVPLCVSPCSPWEPQGAVPARWCGARARVCLPVVCRIGPCLAGYVAGVSVSQCGVWRLEWLGRLGSCFDAGTLRLAWRAGFGVTHPCLVSGSRVASLWSLACPCWGFGRKEYWAVLKPPSRFLTLLAFCGECVPRTILPGYMCRISPASQAFNFPGGGARRSPRCTYPLILALEGNILDDCSITFQWSSARRWVPGVWLAPWPGPLWVRFAGEEGQVEGQVRVGRRPFLCRRRVAGLREAWPPPGGCGRSSLGFCSCSTPRAAKASLYSLSVRCTCRAGRRLSRRCARPTGVGGVCCAAALCRVV